MRLDQLQSSSNTIIQTGTKKKKNLFYSKQFVTISEIFGKRSRITVRVLLKIMNKFM